MIIYMNYVGFIFKINREFTMLGFTQNVYHITEFKRLYILFHVAKSLLPFMDVKTAPPSGH